MAEKQLQHHFDKLVQGLQLSAEERTALSEFQKFVPASEVEDFMRAALTRPKLVRAMADLIVRKKQAIAQNDKALWNSILAEEPGLIEELASV